MPATGLRRKARRASLCSSPGFNKAADQSSAYLCGVSGGQRHQCQDDGSSSGACFFDISGGFSARARGGCIRFVYQLVWIWGWILSTTGFGGLLSLRGESSPSERGLLIAEVSDPLLSGDVMASGHLFRPECSTTTKHIGVSDVLLLVPMKTSDILSSGGRSASLSAPTVGDEDNQESLART